MEQTIIKSAQPLVKGLMNLVKLGGSKLWVDYDREGDVMYLNFGHPQKADNSYQEDGIIRRMKKNKIIGMTILNASRLAK